jgi:hypothetical protein
MLCQTRATSESLLSSFSSIPIIFISYFHDLAIFKSLPRKVHLIILIQELQAIKLKQDNSSYIDQVELMKLLCDDYHKQTAPQIPAPCDLTYMSLYERRDKCAIHEVCKCNMMQNSK